MSIWTEAQVTPILIDMGKFRNSQKKRFCYASFQIVKFDHDNTGIIDVYVMPIGTSMGYDDLHGGDAAAEDTDLRFQVRNGFGYLEEPLVVELHNIGNNQTDSMLQLHAFGPL